MSVAEIEAIGHRVVACARCTELRAYCAEVGRVKRRAFATWDYWAKPVPAFGDPLARVALVGLAPGAHGSNRTGRMFTGDGSGDWLYRALHRAGFASQPVARSIDDGLTLKDCFITAAVRCAPPGNKPTPQQRDACAPFLREEVLKLPNLRVLVTLGKFADDAVHALVREHGRYLEPRARFAHGARTAVELRDRRVTVVASYHPSRQNTQTGVLTEPMLDETFVQVRALLG